MIAGIVLAAGDSSRMGQPKALLLAGSSGESFLDRITRVLAEEGVADLVVVLGRHSAAIRAAVGDTPRPVRLIDNKHPDEGQLSSLIAGLDAVDRPGVRAVLVTPVDLPLLSADTVRRLLDAYRRSGRATIVRPTKAGRHGHPVIFDRSLFDELRRADLRVGARAVVRAHEADVLNVEVSDEGAFTDVDTPGDYERILNARSDGV